jgi:hypothetical protein
VTLAEFVAAHTNQFLDYDGHFGAQCVDLVDFYCVQVLGIPIAWANAVDWYGRDATFLSWTRNAWGNRNSKPPAGAIVVWGASARAGTGVYGHIDVCTDPGDGVTFVGFDQNWPPGSRCHLVRHTYDGVIGWGDKPRPPAPVVVPPPPAADPCAQLRTDLAAVSQQLAGATARTARLDAWIAARPQ